LRIIPIAVIVGILILGTLGLIPVNSAFAITEDFKITASDAASLDLFGTSVSISGDTAIVGAFFDDDAGDRSGSAYIFVRSGSTWTEQAKLTASDAAAGDQFGISVSISGDTAIVGARVDDDAGSSSGSAYVFTRSGTTWTQQAKLTASDAARGDVFGTFVSILGDTAIVGAEGDDDACPSDPCSSGSAYVFVRSGTTWTEQAKLTASDAAAFDAFGIRISISGDTAIVSAPLDDDAGVSSGSAYVFVRSGTTWTQQAKLTASDAAERDRFGISVSISGDTAIVGASDDDDAGPNSGSAYVFVRSGTTWTEQAKLTASDAFEADRFGTSVSILGDTAIAGVPGDDDAGSSSGSAYVFTRSGTTWTEQDKLTASDAAFLDSFGISVSISGDTAIVGANFDSDGGAQSGSAYIFDFEKLLPIEIDIKPRSDPNCFNNDGHGVIPVAILGSDTFDVTTVNPATITLDSAEVKTKGNGDPQTNIEDVNGDGFADLVVKIIDTDGIYLVGTGTATLNGNLFDGTLIEGTDSICITQ